MQLWSLKIKQTLLRGLLTLPDSWHCLDQRTLSLCVNREEKQQDFQTNACSLSLSFTWVYQQWSWSGMKCHHVLMMVALQCVLVLENNPAGVILNQNICVCSPPLRWDGWMASPTQWTWVWVSSGSWWWTGKPGVLQSVGLQRVGGDWANELNWTPQLFVLLDFRTGSLTLKMLIYLAAPGLSCGTLDLELRLTHS